MKRYLITLMLALMCVFALAISVGAKEYTVISDSEYEEVYASAENGDTIIVSEKLTAEIQATKDITYILRADWESSKLNLASNSQVSFVADGGNYKIMPSGYATNGWLYITEAKENVVLSFMGINGGTVTFDGSMASSEHVSNVTVASDITWNLFEGSAIANFNPTKKATGNIACVIYASTFNMYEGSQIYANQIVNVPLVKTNDFHMHGGEIFGNLLTSANNSEWNCGAIYIKNQFVMWDGNIYNNIFKAKGNAQINYIGFFTTFSEKPTILLGGEVGVNYTAGNASNEISAMFGGSKNTKVYGYYTSDYKPGTRKVFTSGECELIYDEASGKTVWQISNPTFGTVSEGWLGYSWVHYKGLCDNAVTFLNVDIKQIEGNNFYELDLSDLFVIGVTAANGSNVVAQKNYTYSYTGKSSLTIPEGAGAFATEVDGYCHKGSTVTLEQINQNMPIVLYASYENPITEETGTTLCSICKEVFMCEFPEHEKIETITYKSYTESGLKSVRCKICNTVASTKTPALFVCLGYSAPENGRGGITIGFRVNNEGIKDYEEITGKTLKYGVFAASLDKLKDGDIFENGVANENAICAEIKATEFTAFDLKITGFTEEQKGTKLALGAYVAVSNGENTEYSYMQDDTKGEKIGNYFFVSLNDISK